MAHWFTGMAILELGFVEVSTWRPDGRPEPRQATSEWIKLGGVARTR